MAKNPSPGRLDYGDYYQLLSTMVFYLGFGMQLMGLACTGLCLLSGLTLGDYGRMELIQFIVGILFFYMGTALKKRCKNS